MKHNLRSAKNQRHDYGSIRYNLGHLLHLAQKALTACFIFTLPLLLYVFNTEYAFTKVVFALVMISLLYALWGVQAWLQQEIRLRLPPLFWPGMVLVLAGGVSSINALNPAIGLQNLWILIYFFAFYVYIANLVQEKGDLQLFLGTALVAVLGAALYGLLQYYGVLIGTINDAGRPVDSGSVVMISSLGNKNFLAEFLSSWFVPSLVFLIFSMHRWMKILLLTINGIAFTALWAADSTGALIGMAVSLAFFFAGSLITYRTSKLLWRSKGWIVGWGLILVLSYGIIVNPGFLDVHGCIWNNDCFVDADIPERSSVLVDESAVNTSIHVAEVLPISSLKWLNPLMNLWETYLNLDRTRTWNWGIAFEMFRRNLLFGVGLGHYEVEYYTYKAKLAETDFGKQFDFYALRARYAHNDYMQLAAEMGVMGIAAGILLLFTLVWRGIQHLKRGKNGQHIASLAMYAGSLAIFVDALVNFPMHLPATVLSLTLLLGFSHSRFLYSVASEIRLKRWTLHMLVVGFLVIGMATSVYAYREYQANVHLDRGNRYAREGFPQVAEREYQQSLALTFAPGEVFYRLGGITLNLGRSEEAQLYLEKSLSSFVTEQTFWNLAVLHYQKQDFEAAQEYLNILLAIEPQKDLLQEAQRMHAELSQ